VKTVGWMSALGFASVAAFALWAARSTAAEVVKRPEVGTQPGHVGHGTPLRADGSHQLAIFSQGCFWGTEERFRQVPGVVSTAVGYTGGKVADPSYQQVSAHGTGHAESVLLEFDPARISYAKLLDIFWSSHDPTSGDRQGPDVGSQYRSAIFTFGEEQQRQALASRDAEQKRLADPITTQIVPAGPFWVAEDYHQQWDEKHGYESCPIPHRPRSASR
jgi:peptide-methionine (S)-S-oxide reductase